VTKAKRMRERGLLGDINEWESKGIIPSNHVEKKVTSHY
jgi:hypothetical protein